MAATYVGIVLDDPGGIAWIDGSGKLHCRTAPSRYGDVWQVMHSIRQESSAVRCLIEKLWESPRGVGLAVAVRHGRQMGRFESLALAAFGELPEYVNANIWQRAMCGQIRCEKQLLQEHARRLFKDALTAGHEITVQTAPAILLAGFAKQTDG